MVLPMGDALIQRPHGHIWAVFLPGSAEIARKPTRMQLQRHRHIHQRLT